MASVFLAIIIGAVAIGWLTLGGSGPAQAADFTPVVEAEETVYSYNAPENGSGPTWCHGSTCIVRVGGRVFISGEEAVPEAKPLNNVRWQLFERGEKGWEMIAKGPGRTREPCPLTCFPDGTLFLSDNPTITAPDQYNGPARPEVLAFSAERPREPYQTLLPAWDGQPEFTEHSYRSFAADGKRKELILFQNVGYTHSAWSFRDSQGEWSAHGELKWPWGAEYAEPQPIRVCYPTVALKDRAVYFCGVSDIIEPNAQWGEYKAKLTGREWDYDFRRLFFTWSDDITTGRFHEWVEVSSREKTCGWIFPCDLWVGPDGAVHLLWTERALDERLREKFFPGEKQSWALMYAVVRNGRVESKRALVLATEESGGPRVGDARFHVTADGRLFVFYYCRDKGTDGKELSENRLLEIKPDGTQSESVKVDLKNPMNRFFTTTWRAGCAPSDLLEMYGDRGHREQMMGYARIRVK